MTAADAYRTRYILAPHYNEVLLEQETPREEEEQTKKACQRHISNLYTMKKSKTYLQDLLVLTCLVIITVKETYAL